MKPQFEALLEKTMTTKHFDIKDVKQKAQGRWHDILSHLCAPLTDALAKPGKHVDCSIHGGKKDFRLYPDYEQTGGGVCTCGNYIDGFNLLSAANNWTLDETINSVASMLGMTGNKSVAPVRKTSKLKVDKEKVAKTDTYLRNLLQKSWDSSAKKGDFRVKFVLQYLAKRGLKLNELPSCLRFNAAMPYYDEDTEKNLGDHPVMLAQAKNPKGQPVTLHRTYLDYSGNKADVSNAKKLMAHPSGSSISGGAIRLFEASSVLGLAEGIETALAVNVATSMPVWACISNILLERVIIPDSVKLVVIWADKDRSNAGQCSAQKLSKRLESEGFQTIIMLPHGDIGDKKGIDWLDMLNRYGRECFFQDQLEIKSTPGAQPPLNKDILMEEHEHGTA